MWSRICAKCGKTDGPFSKRKARCNPCLAEDQKDYVARQDKEKFKEKQRSHNAVYRDSLRARGLPGRLNPWAGEHVYRKRRWGEVRAAILKKYGGVCAKCGFSDARALQVDHVEGGGSRERRKRAPNLTYYTHVLFDTTGKFQLLCANCNTIKKFENKEFGMAFAEKKGA